MLDEKVAKELAFLKQENLYRKVKTVTSIKKNKILIFFVLINTSTNIQIYF